MRKYELFLIKEDIAKHYVGRERLIYSLFVDYKKAVDEHRMVLHKQINFITLPIDHEKERLQFISRIYNQKNIQVDVAEAIMILCKNSRAKITFSPHTIKLETEGDYEAEMLIFELLRKSQPYFMAVDIQKNVYGWLKPIKERKLV